MGIVPFRTYGTNVTKAVKKLLPTLNFTKCEVMVCNMILYTYISVMTSERSYCLYFLYVNDKPINLYKPNATNSHSSATVLFDGRRPNSFKRVS